MIVKYKPDLFESTASQSTCGTSPARTDRPLFGATEGDSATRNAEPSRKYNDMSAIEMGSDRIGPRPNGAATELGRLI